FLDARFQIGENRQLDVNLGGTVQRRRHQDPASGPTRLAPIALRDQLVSRSASIEVPPMVGLHIISASQKPTISIAGGQKSICETGSNCSRLSDNYLPHGWWSAAMHAPFPDRCLWVG
ncbi:hypothetical protein, partial [Mesorhizobium sp.]|uniref:hypothetical protein n=1 Tax=Mesorhizobium sp. TaxID=1871066 RepID=UPI0025EF52C5